MDRAKSRLVSWRGAGLAVMLIALASLVAYCRPWSVRVSPDVSSTANVGARTKPASRTSRFLNTASDVPFLGAAACRECHPSEYASYLRTGHSQALGEVDPAQEPPDARFVHAASGRTYEVLRRDGKLIHRESLPGPDEGEPIVVEHAMRYTIGSGHHSRSYLLEQDGFLIESPLTWYAAPSQWAMSPGYDRPHHSGFERVADTGCLFCHAGRIEPQQGSRFRLTIHESRIGCESCHGPGGLHAPRQAGKSTAGSPAAEDLTIVHPARLTREESESVCGQCHLRGGATPSVRGKRLLDFRPGLRLADFQVDFVPERTESQMKVVGHMEQMRASACYRGSDMTCTTCHDPHGRPPPDERVAYYRNRCNACHESGCNLDAATRLAQVADDNCITCHMPQKPTDLAHFAFTHHRIGFHDGASVESANDRQPVTLVPMSDLTDVSPADRDRLLGLAYMEFAHLHGAPQDKESYLRRAKQHLLAAREGGASDAVLEAGLAQIDWNEHALGPAVAAARRSLLFPDLETGSHAAAWFVLADAFVELRDPGEAEQALTPLIEARRMAQNWVLLSQVRQQAGDMTGALNALLQAARASPFRADIQHQLSRLYQELGQTSEADRHHRLARYLDAPLANTP